MVRSITSRYPRNLPLKVRIFLTARWRFTPYHLIASQLPERGRILDLGCGHGLLALAAAMGSSDRAVIGIDHDEERVRLATHARQDLTNLEFEVGNMMHPPPGPFQGIAMIDVMHYFEPQAQEKLARQARDLLDPGGVLLVREVDPRAGFVSAWNRLYEKLATASGFTRAEKKGLHFRSRVGWEEMLASAGFQVSARTCSSILFADVLYVCRHNPR